MRYKPKEFVLKNGLSCIIKSPGPEDAISMLQLMRTASDETDFLARYSDEIDITVSQEQQFLQNCLKSKKDLMLCALVQGNLVANAGITPIAPHQRYAHRTSFGISINQKYWGLGIGSLLISAVISSAHEMGYEQLELEVVSGNERGLALYRKYGFEIYGTRNHAFKYRDGTYASEYLMMLKL
ncbi:GNAT family N-acetyltransferase [Lacrimispora algidixylanolytica]|uniref:GNAT family N-acetyltransferase n=1 Tax=Lacrimispora algidixylanolytica TaxID=94868 RepID=A0A419T158_9FIRM|nr:GNAT family N-acetyltransferase [Lacrimispora algidixylanolytica]RKD31310.1 GNAT family N-acetyltransferase [Lacrimispora algidixylanolytica]